MSMCLVAAFLTTLEISVLGFHCARKSSIGVMSFSFPWRKSPSDTYSSLQDTDSENDGSFPSKKEQKSVIISSLRLFYILFALFAICLFGALFQIHVEIERRPFSTQAIKSPIPDCKYTYRSSGSGLC